MNMKNSRSRVGLLLFGIALSTVLVVMTGCGSKETTQTTSTSQSQFTAVAAKAGSVSVVVEAPAVVEPYLTQTVRSTIEGVVTFAVPEGASIKKGEVLVRFDQGDQQKAVRSAELARAQSRVNRDKAADALAMAVKDLGDKETLLKTGAVPQDLVRAASDAVTSAKRSLELADIVVAQAALALETAQNDLHATSVRAPIDGVVLSGNLNPGDLVARGGALLTVADISRLRLNAEVDEYDIGKVTSGLPVTVTSDTLGKEVLQSTVERVSKAAQIVNNIPIFKVYTVLPNRDERLKPGMSTDISILIRSDKGITVPSAAVSAVRGRSYIKVQNQGETQTKRVETGADNGTSIVVLSGLVEGEMVLVPSSAGLDLGSTQSTVGTSVVPITIPGSGGTK